jgi:hypothetical protein
VPAEGVELGAARSYAAQTVITRDAGLREATWLAAPATLATMDFSTATEAGVHAEVTCDVEVTGICHGWLGWSSLDLGGRWLSTSPKDPPLHWSPMLLPIDPPVPVERGERVTFGLDRPPSSEWSWTMQTAREARQHSTFRSMPMTPATLERALGGYRPRRTAQGDALVETLTRCDGTASVQAIAEALHARHPQLFATEAAALIFVQRAVKRYA